MSRQSVYAAVWMLLSKGLTYLLLLVIANKYSVADYGKFSFIFSLLVLLSFFSALGMPYYLVPWIQSKKKTGPVVFILAALSTLFSALIITSAWKTDWIVVLALLLPLWTLNGLGSSLLWAQRKYGLDRFFCVVDGAVTLAIAFAASAQGLTGLASAYVLGYIVQVTVSFLYLRKHLQDAFRDFRFHVPTLSRYLMPALVTSLVYLSLGVLNWLDTFVLGLFRASEEVAYYTVASQICSLLALIPTALSFVVLTRKDEKTTFIASKLSFLISLNLAIILIAVREPLLAVFFPKYPIGLFIGLLSTGMLFYSVYIMHISHAMSIMKPHMVLPKIITACTINIALDFILAPTFGIYGVIASTFIAQLVALLLIGHAQGYGKLVSVVFIVVISVGLALFLKLYALLLPFFIIPLMVVMRLISPEDLHRIVRVAAQSIKYK